MIPPMGPAPAKIMIIGDCPGPEELHRNVPFSGSLGIEFSKMCHEAGLNFANCFVTNLIHDREPNISKAVCMLKKDISPMHLPFRDKMVLPSVIEGVRLIEKEIKLCEPNLIIACGNIAFWVLTGNWGVNDWRGSIVSNSLVPRGPKVLALMSPGIVFKQWPLRAVMVQDLRRAKREAEDPHLRESQYHFTVAPSFTTARETLLTLIAKCDAGETKIACDIETRNWNIACIGFAWSKYEAICIPLMCLKQKEGYWTLEEETILVNLMQDLLTHKNCVTLGQNYIFDQQYIHRFWGFISSQVRDTMIAQHVCFLDMKKSLDFISSMYCDTYKYWKEDGKIWARDVNELDLWKYNCEDACRTWECDEVLQRIVDNLNLREQHDFQQALFYPVLQAMIRGVRINEEYQQRVIKELREARVSATEWITDLIGHPINIRSPKQISDLFYKELGQKPIIKRGTGRATTDSEALGKIARREPVLSPIIEKIEELRSIGIFLSTFLGERTGKWTRSFLDDDGRVRCSYGVAGTVTLRLSSSESAFGHGTNLQNVPGKPRGT